MDHAANEDVTPTTNPSSTSNDSVSRLGREYWVLPTVARRLLPAAMFRIIFPKTTDDTTKTQASLQIQAAKVLLAMTQQNRQAKRKRPNRDKSTTHLLAELSEVLGDGRDADFVARRETVAAGSSGQANTGGPGDPCNQGPIPGSPPPGPTKPEVGRPSDGPMSPTLGDDAASSREIIAD